MPKVIFYKEDKDTKKMEKCMEYNCKKCMVFDNVVALDGVEGCNATVVRIPLFRIDKMETYN